MTRLRHVPLPRSGSVRVHPAPEALPQLRHEGTGRNRFDDPHGSFLMRYTAENLRGCLVETMARFRPNPAADALLAAVEFAMQTLTQQCQPFRPSRTGWPSNVSAR